MNSDEAIALIEDTFGTLRIEPGDIPPVFSGPFCLCGWCHQPSAQWTMIQGQPAPMHERCVRPWLLAEAGVDVEAREVRSRRAMDGKPIIPDEALGVYGKWAKKREGWQQG